MFETTFENMTAFITVESGIFGVLGQSNVGLGFSGIKEGGNTYTSRQAIEIIRKIDKALVGCPKHLFKRIRATRMQFVFAFGPEMETVAGVGTVKQ